VANRNAADAARASLQDTMENTTPELNQQFLSGAKQYGDATGAAQRAAAAGGQMAMRGGGALLGAGAGAYGGGDNQDWTDRAQHAAMGAAVGFGVAPYAADAGANLMRGVQGSAGMLSGLANGVANSAGAIVPPSAEQQRSQLRDASQESVGSNLANVVNQALINNPQMLGRWRGDLEAAGKAPGGIQAALMRLNRDNDWRMTVLPQLQQMTGEQ
jgi:hypothetical protein